MTMSNLKVMQMSEADIATHFPNLEEVRKEAAPWMEDWHARVWSTSEWDAPEDIQKKYDKYVTMPMWTIDGGHRSVALFFQLCGVAV